MKHALLASAACCAAGAGLALMAMAADGPPPDRPEPAAALHGTPTADEKPDTNGPALPAFTNSYFAATNWAQRLDWLHDMATFVSEQNIRRADNWFVDDPAQRAAFQPAKFRFGLQLEGDYFGHTNDYALKPLADAECAIHMPNAEKRLRLTISTLDPTALPSQNDNQGLSGLRVGLKQGILKDIDTAAGVRIKWPPSVYTHAAWNPSYRLADWDVYPEQKVGWDNDDGIYETTSLMMNRWINRCVIRPIASLKLSRERYQADMDRLRDQRRDNETAGLPPPDGNYPKGWEWELTLLGGYANELIDETLFGRLADGRDIARGGGFRFSVLGSLHIIESYNLTLLYRGRLYKRWLYYVIKPEASWQDENNWKANYSLTLGLDILIYGTRER